MARKFSQYVTTMKGIEAVTFKPGDDVPDWLEVGDHALEPLDDADNTAVEALVDGHQNRPSVTEVEAPGLVEEEQTAELDFTKPAPAKRNTPASRK